MQLFFQMRCYSSQPHDPCTLSAFQGKMATTQPGGHLRLVLPNGFFIFNPPRGPAGGERERGETSTWGRNAVGCLRVLRLGQSPQPHLCPTGSAAAAFAHTGQRATGRHTLACLLHGFQACFTKNHSYKERNQGCTRSLNKISNIQGPNRDRDWGSPKQHI